VLPIPVATIVYSPVAQKVTGLELESGVVKVGGKVVLSAPFGEKYFEERKTRTEIWEPIR
jgi:hypothetical protein